jgi:hypothetical protein
MRVVKTSHEASPQFSTIPHQNKAMRGMGLTPFGDGGDGFSGNRAPSAVFGDLGGAAHPGCLYISIYPLISKKPSPPSPFLI